MQLSRIDLNLLTVFDAIVREGGITPASKRLHLSQSAVSHALARLRELLGDPLFERRGNDMIPTPLARSLSATVAGSLSSIEQVLQHAGRFDPARSRRSFTIAMRESQEGAILPALIAGICRKAPGVRVASVRIERSDLEDDLLSGEIDAALDAALPLPLSADVRHLRLASEPLVVLARRKHPAARGRMDLAAYLAMEHVLVTGRRRGNGHVDVALGRLGMSRRIRVRCQQHAAACDIVGRTDLLATMSRRQAGLANQRAGNQVLPFPAEMPPVESFLYWHANVDADAASQWFRKRVSQALASAG